MTGAARTGWGAAILTSHWRVPHSGVAMVTGAFSYTGRYAARRLLSEGLAVGLLPLADAAVRHQEWGFRRVSGRGVV